MNVTNKLPGGLTRALGKLWMKTKKVSPEICVIGGIVCGAGALVLVGVQTWKKKDILQQDKDSIRTFTTEFVTVKDEDKEKLSKKQQKKLVVHPEFGDTLLPVKIQPNTLTDDQKQALLARRIDFARDIVKAYWLPVTLEIGSIALIWKGRTILRKDLSAMTAAYAAALEAYRKYRKRVAEEYGAEKDQEFACGYKMEETVDENGNVHKVAKPDADGSRNPYGFWVNEGYYDETGRELLWRNFWYTTDKKKLLWKVKEEQEKATFELRTIGIWRLENTMLRMGQPPKEAAKYHYICKIWKEGSDNKVDFGVFEGPNQLACNRGFTDQYCSQNVCYINPVGVEYVADIDENIEKYDHRYSRNAGSEMPYKSFVRESNRLIERYNREKMEQKIFNGMSDFGKRRMAKILK